jgi:hypothetical protein
LRSTIPNSAPASDTPTRIGHTSAATLGLESEMNSKATALNRSSKVADLDVGGGMFE